MTAPASLFPNLLFPSHLKYFLTILTAATASLALAAIPLATKANLLHGAYYVTPELAPAILEQAFAKTLDAAHYTPVDAVRADLADATLYADLFVYQAAASNPVIFLTLRDRRGEIVHTASATRTVFGDRKRLLVKLAEELAGGLPAEPVTDMRYFPTADHLTGQRGGATFGLTAIITKEIAQSQTRKLAAGLAPVAEFPGAFLVPGAFPNYLAAALALSKVKRRLAEGGVAVVYEVDAAGVSRFVSAEAERPLKGGDVRSLERCVAAFPRWIGAEVAGTYALRIE